MMHTLNRVHHMDIFDLCDCLEDDSIDMILCDLPYGITACEWDSVIPFEPMWEQFKRIIKPRGAVVLTASGKFTYKLAMSNFEWLKYEWTIIKKYPSLPGSSKKQPMRKTEVALVFCDSVTMYYPQMTPKPKNRIRHRSASTKFSEIYNSRSFTRTKESYERKVCYPTNIINVDQGAPFIRKNPHPTQKPVALFEYLIRTYTQPGDVVFDPCVGSGTTALAARNTGRNFIVGDSSAEYVNVAIERLAKPYTVPMFEETIEQEKPEQLGMELADESEAE